MRSRQLNSGTPNNPQSLLFVIRGADLQLATDQALTRMGAFTNYTVTKVIAKQVSGGASVACTGGIYTGAGKTGNALVAATQSWLNLTATGKIVDATLAAINGTDAQSATPILSLTTGSTAAATADVMIWGVVVD